VSDPIRVVVVDDEPLARRGICARLVRAADFKIIRQCAGGRDAVQAIREEKPDLVFLDVQMPGLDGFGVVREIGPDLMPPIVFVTAYDEHALAAFEAQALDYLLKPIDDERFDRSLARARRRVEERRGYRARVEHGQLLVRERGRVELVEIERIAWVEARGDYVRLHAEERHHLLRDTMAGLERRLDPSRFVRIHRSTIVNIGRIRRVQLRTGRDWTVTLDDGTQLKLGRRYRSALEQRLPPVAR
jgi:two-component system LytT family response regulator